MTEDKEKQKWHCAVKNTTTDKKKWYYHLFYDFDNIQLSAIDIERIVKMAKIREISFILRKSLHGYHFIGLTPLSPSKWGILFDMMQDTFPTYHDGQAIRITQKEIGEFIIVASDFSYPFVVNLAKLFVHTKNMFNFDNERAIKEQWYVLLYYTVNKTNILNKQVISRKYQQ